MVSRPFDHKRAIAAGLVLLFVIAGLPVVRASDSLRPRKSHSHSLGGVLPEASLLADLDGDCAIDSVKLSSNGLEKSIVIKFANRRISEFSFAANISDPGTLVAKDIDRDGDVDLIWLGNRDQKNAVILINDGQGEFTRTTDNAPYASELRALVSGDPPEQDSAQANHHDGSLTSSSFSDIGLITSSLLLRPEIQFASFFGAAGFTNRAAFLNYLHKRGPPLILS